MKQIKEFAAIEEKLIPKYEPLHDYVFHFNVYTQEWNAIPRNLYNEYWSNSNQPGVIQNKTFTTLLEKIKKAK